MENTQILTAANAELTVAEAELTVAEAELTAAKAELKVAEEKVAKAGIAYGTALYKIDELIREAIHNN